MITKTIGTIFIVLICIIMFPVALGLIGGAFGIVMGVIGAVFGAFAGIIGGIFGAIFGVFEWMFDSLFDWHGPFHFFGCNFFTLATIVLVVALLVRNKNRQ
jgi:hypothetical protein